MLGLASADAGKTFQIVPVTRTVGLPSPTPKFRALRLPYDPYLVHVLGAQGGANKGLLIQKSMLAWDKGYQPKESKGYQPVAHQFTTLGTLGGTPNRDP